MGRALTEPPRARIRLFTEVVLALLLSHFVFELSDKPIVWNISGIRFPTVGVDGTKPELPLRVSLYDPNGASASAASSATAPSGAAAQH